MSVETPNTQHVQPKENPSHFEIRPYRPDEAQKIYDSLEEPNWAPWLRATPETLARRAEIFPEGQLAVWEGERPIASISLNRFNFDGNPENLPTWDELAGSPSTYEQTFVPDGNAVGMMSINVSPDYQGKGLTKTIIAAVKDLKPRIGIEHVMGSFRPSQFGDYSHEKPYAHFTSYVDERNPEGMPLDAWLRALHRNGMVQLRIDDAAMVVPDVSREEFDSYRAAYTPEKWKQIAPSVWRCGETGVWIVGEKTAAYVESNVWGILEEGIKNGENGSA